MFTDILRVVGGEVVAGHAKGARPDLGAEIHGAVFVCVCVCVCVWLVGIGIREDEEKQGRTGSTYN